MNLSTKSTVRLGPKYIISLYFVVGEIDTWITDVSMTQVYTRKRDTRLSTFVVEFAFKVHTY